MKIFQYTVISISISIISFKVLARLKKIILIFGYLFKKNKYIINIFITEQ